MILKRLKVDLYIILVCEILFENTQEEDLKEKNENAITKPMTMKSTKIYRGFF
ncbi:hypothetical protein [uncultured Winogradskyella sp.]|uniref:hypothetical protein n=1 Tax=uncultured Winogradskyella sp. TaxID=395353 RepID=UPI0026273F61|nr:hypothetical protein [uncultured Winogradskyella sp.]